MSWRPAACPTSRPWSPLGPLPLCPWWVAPRTRGPLPTRSGRSFGPVRWGSRVGKPPQWPRSCNRRATATWILQSPPTSRPGTESTPAWCPQTSLTGPSWTQAWAKIAKDFAWNRPRLYYYKGRNMDKLWWTMINHMITYDELDHLAKFSTAIRSKIHVAWCKKYAKRESPLQPLFPEMEAEGHEPTMRQVAQTWLGPKSYHTSQRPSLQVVWESLAVSLKSTIFHTGGLHCHGKITSIKMGFARLPVVVVWRLVDMTCLCNQPECSCASEDNHSNLRGCKATLHMWWRNIGKCRSVMQKKREVIILRQFEPSLSLSICCWLIWYISGLWWQTEWLWHQQHAEHSSSSSCIMFSDVTWCYRGPRLKKEHPQASPVGAVFTRTCCLS